jgi:S1-C subfamily serine protease
MIIHRPRSLGRRMPVPSGLFVLILSLLWCAMAQAGQATVQAGGERCTDAISDVYDRVSPAVVFITATSINPYSLADRVQRVTGSGVIINASGLILTNAHLVIGRQSITVTLDNGTVFPAQHVGADPIFDLAVIRIPHPSSGTLPTVVLGNSGRIRVGEEVLAIGNPMGLEQTLTRGIISAINRVLPETPFSLSEPMIQTDAPINPGNSGGPLLNRCGEVIGINTAILPEAQNIGFAIPIDLVKAALPSLLSQGRVVRPWLGFHGQFVGEQLRSLLRIPLVDGLLVEVVEPGSPADREGIRGGELEIVIAGRGFLVGGDIVTGLNGTPLTSPETLIQIMRGLQVGSSVRLTLFRDGAYREVEYTLPERPMLPEDIRIQGSLAPVTGRSAQAPGNADPPGTSK